MPLSKIQIKLIRSLQLKKYREEEGLFVAEGKKIVEEIINSDIAIEHIYVSELKKKEIDEILNPPAGGQHRKNFPVTIISPDELDKISALTTSQSVLAVCVIPAENKIKPDLKKELVLALDDIRDPGNLGTIMRIADWFNIKHIYCSEESVDVYNPKVVQASMGSIARVNVHYTNLQAMFKEMGEGIPIYGALLNGKNVYSEKLSPNGVLVIGNESNGISKEVQSYVTHPVSIPAYNSKGPESLNAAIATAILCAEFRRSNL